MIIVETNQNTQIHTQRNINKQADTDTRTQTTHHPQHAQRKPPTQLSTLLLRRALTAVTGRVILNGPRPEIIDSRNRGRRARYRGASRNTVTKSSGINRIGAASETRMLLMLVKGWQMLSLRGPLLLLMLILILLLRKARRRRRGRLWRRS